jgi:hypothetical protein
VIALGRVLRRGIGLAGGVGVLDVRASRVLASDSIDAAHGSVDLLKELFRLWYCVLKYVRTVSIGRNPAVLEELRSLPKVLTGFTGSVSS